MSEKISQKLANLLPKKIIYFALIRAWSKATTGEYSNTVVPEVRMDTVIKRWGLIK